MYCVTVTNVIINIAIDTCQTRSFDSSCFDEYDENKMFQSKLKILFVVTKYIV